MNAGYFERYTAFITSSVCSPLVQPVTGSRKLLCSGKNGSSSSWTFGSNQMTMPSSDEQSLQKNIAEPRWTTGSSFSGHCQ